ncbi:hypothetical protein NLX85_21990 [Micromonospora sp. A3M-1-15]|uniref:hypothetical protein n=1 Tax=Micromonospora sp. A3M-1-15 TaxID=2962035 RepID=UPI0020B8CCE7|nr:hypothetical protein [Micromonospora sp. A3M-1-15]MCP3786039.1 hypothetical protein [Micromonospora sp. A3M-1-15]
MTDWQTLSEQVRSRVLAVNAGTAVAFAAITAERLMRLDPQRLPFTQSLRPLLDLVWRAAAGDQTAFKPIAVALGQFYISEYCHNDGPDGPDDADDDPAAATLYAAECYLHAEPRFAANVAGRAIAAVEYRMELATEDYTGDEAIDADAAMDAEARQQLADLDALARHATKLSRARFGLPADDREYLLAALRNMVTVPTPTPSTCEG